MTTFPDELPSKRHKTALQQIQEQIERQMRPFNNAQEMRELAKLYSLDEQLKDFRQQFEPPRHIRELLGGSALPSQIREAIDGSSIAEQAKRMMEKYIPKNLFAGLGTYNETVLQSAGLAMDNEEMRRVMEAISFNDVPKHYQRYLAPLSEQQEKLEKLRRQAIDGFSAADFARQLRDINPAFRAMEEARKSLDSLWLTFRDIEPERFEASDEDTEEAEQAAKLISQAASAQDSFQKAVERIVIAILAEKKPTVQLMLWLAFSKILDWLIAGAIGAVMGHFTPAVLGDSPQAAKKAVQESARAVVETPQLLMDYRYVSAKVLIVRQNPGALSPEIGRLSFGKAVKLQKKEKDFALVLWSDKESGAEIQGWVFSRYLGKFN
jgi:hypothetical protein